MLGESSNQVEASEIKKSVLRQALLGIDDFFYSFYKNQEKQLFLSQLREKIMALRKCFSGAKLTLNPINQMELAKFWCLLVLILDQNYKCHDNKKYIQSDLSDLVVNDFFADIRLIDDEYWKDQMLVAWLDIAGFQTVESVKNSVHRENLFGNFKNKIKESYQNIKKGLCVINNESQKYYLDYMKNILKQILGIISDCEKTKRLKDKVIECLLDYRIDKNALIKFNPIYRLPHTIILGLDAGIFMLLNHITPEEEKIMLKCKEICPDYLSKIKKSTENDGSKKIRVGGGAFGEVRLALVLCENMNTIHGRTGMKLGDVICVKKYLKVNKNKMKRANSDILIYAIKDYYAEPELVFSPEAYDLCFIFNPALENKHSKAYTFQRFYPAMCGDEIINKEWPYIFKFMCDLFDGIIKLLNKGICLLDFKLENTLYDFNNNQGRFIDTGGSVYKTSREELITFKVDSRHYEFTARFSSPEINAANIGDVVNLIKAIACNFGKTLKYIVLKNKFKDCPNPKKLEMIIEKLEKHNPKERWFLEQAFDEFKQIGPGVPPTLFDLEPKLKDIQFAIEEEMLYKESGGEKLSFSLLENSNKLIPIYVQNMEEEKELEEKELIDEVAEKFLKINELSETKVMFIGGPMGAGKSLFLKRLYLQCVRNWKPKKPFPFYVDLSRKLNLKTSFANMVEEIKDFKNDPNYDFPFTLFTKEKYSMILFLDGFDKAGDKRNVIAAFFEELNFNQNIKIFVNSQEDFFKNPREIIEWFEGNYFKCWTYKILPLNFEENKNFKDLENFMKMNEYLPHEEPFDKTIDFINEHDLMKFMRTPLEVKMNAKIIPELHESFKNNKTFGLDIIYEEYVRKIIIENKEEYNSQDGHSIVEKMLMKELKIDPEDKYYERFCIQLAIEIHLNKGKVKKKIDSSQDHRNLPLYFLSRILKSIVNFTFSKEHVSLEFYHDSLLIYYLTKSFQIQEVTTNEIIDILSDFNKSCQSYLVEVLQNNNGNSKKTIKKLLLRIIENTKEDKLSKAIRASSNAISILIKAKIPLINKDFTNIDITEANLSHGILSGSNFSNSNLTAVNLTACKMDGCFFINTVIKDAIFTDFYSFELDIQKPIIGVVRNPEKDNANSCCLIVCCKNGNVYEVDLFYPKEKDPKLLKLDYNKEKCSPVPLVANCMAISQKSPKFVIGSRDKDLLFFERNAIESKFDKAIKPLFSRYPPRSISFSNNEKYIIELSETNYIKFWKVDPNTGEFTDNESNSKCLSNLGDLNLNCQTPAYDDSFILIAADNGLLYIWSKPFQKDLTSFYILRDFKSPITSFCSSKNSWKFLCGTRNGEIHSFELKENNGLMEIYMGASANANNEITVLKMMKHETCFLSGDVTGRITLWLFKFSAAMTVIMPLKYFDGHQKSMIVSLELNKCEEYIISSSSDAKIIIWKIGDIHELKSLKRHALNYSVTSIDVSDDCSFIVSGGTDGCVILNSGKSKGFLDKIQAHEKMIKCVIISKDKQFLVTAGDDGRIIKWDRSTGKFHKEFGIEGNSTHKESVNEIMQSKNGVFLISGSEDWTVKLWDFDLGSQILILGNNSEIKCLCFSPDCNEILTGEIKS